MHRSLLARARRVLAAILLATGLASTAGAQTPAAAVVPGAEAGRAMIVLDASGSMWAPVGGRAKIEIAREAMGELLKGWDPKVEVGLMAYGHRRKGDCSDIEVLAPAAKPDAARLMGIVNRVQPMGMTPLSAAVKQAAESLKYTEKRATVILVSDGIETCGADPCALGAELKKLGIDFRAHVIGFDVQRQDEGGLRCLANATGGKYFSAKDAGALRDALKAAGQEATAAPVPKPPAPPVAAKPAAAAPKPAAPPSSPAIVLVAPKSVTAGDTLQIAWTGSNSREDIVGFTLPRNEQVGANAVDTSPGSPATLRAPDRPGAYEMVYWSSSTGRIVARAAIEVVPAKATLEAVETVTIGGTVDVAWTGPNGPEDFVTIVAPTAGKSDHGDYAKTGDGSPGKVRVPDRAGTYEIRYVTGRDNEILARRTVVALAARVDIEAVSSAPAGSRIKVKWTGAPNNRDDFITIVKPDAEKSAAPDFFATKDHDPETATLLVPPRPGDYELRYVTGQTNEILARRPLVSTATTASLDAPASAPAGSRVKVGWTGPNNTDDFVTVVTPDAGKGTYTESFASKDADPATASLKMPGQPGTYELRYVAGGSNETLAKRTITVTAVQASLEVPAAVPAGSRIVVKWTGPNNEGDFVTVVRPDAGKGDYTQYFEPKGIDPDEAKLTLPARAGDYEVRYVTGGENRILSRAPIKAQPFAIAITAPDSARAGKEFEFSWTGPKLPDNYFTMVKPDADPDATDQTVNVDRENELRFTPPSEPGTYELRYVVPSLKRVMAKKTIVVK